jgi:Sedlin, N-terminal conserved region
MIVRTNRCLTGTDMKFILLHETKNDDGIKSFFNDVWELYVKVRAVFPNEPSLVPIYRLIYILPSDDAEPFPHRPFTNTEYYF